MKYFDRISDDPLARQIQSAIFDHTRSTNGELDMVYIDRQVRRLRSVYITAAIGAAARALWNLARDRFARSKGHSSIGSRPQSRCTSHC